jgi:transposase-like protein
MRKGQRKHPEVKPEEIAFTEAGHMKVFAKCPYCASFHHRRDGEDGKRHARVCLSCGKRFCVDMTPPESA